MPFLCGVSCDVHEVHKYLPIKLYVQSIRSSYAAVAKSVKRMIQAGASVDEVDTFITGAEVKMLNGKGKDKALCDRANKASKISGKVKKNELQALVQRLLDTHEDGVCKLVLSFF